MTVYMLSRGSSVTIQRSRLTVNVSLPTRSCALRVAGPAGEPVDHIAPAPGILIIPEPPDAFAVTVESTGGEFPAGALIHADVRAEGVGYAEADDVRLADSIDPAGLRSVTILQFQATGDSVQVFLPSLPTQSVDLSSSAEAMRVETRRQMGSVDAGDRHVVVALDGSASTRVLSRENLTLALELVMGFASSVTTETRISGALIAQDARAVEAQDYSQLPVRLVEELGRVPLRSQSALTAGSFVSTLPADSMVLFVSDALPADFAELGGLPVDVRLVVLMNEDAWSVETQGVTIPVPAAPLDVEMLARLPESHRDAQRTRFVQALAKVGN